MWLPWQAYEQGEGRFRILAGGGGGGGGGLEYWTGARRPRSQQAHDTVTTSY